MYSKNQSIKIKMAFTLAEILITLAIIGVVAAITIPSLNNNMNKQDTVAKVKKAYSVLSQSTESIKSDCGGSISNCIIDPNAADNDATSRQEVANLYKAKLQINKECPTITDFGCFANETYKYLNNVSAYNYATYSLFNNARFSLTDGVAISVDWEGESSSPGALFRTRIDVNGVKSPNQWGKDLFMFYYDSKNNVLKPYGDGSDCTTSSTGLQCAQKILKEGEITYY